MAELHQPFGRAVDATQLRMTVANFQVPLLEFKNTAAIAGLHTPTSTPKGRTHLMYLSEYVYGNVKGAARLGVVLKDLEALLPIAFCQLKVPRRIVAIEIRQATFQISRKNNFSI